MIPPRVLLFYVVLSLMPVLGDSTDVLAVSPQKTWQIQRRQIGNLGGGDPQFIDFVDLKSDKIIFSFVSIRRSTDAEWNSEGTFVAINDRIATSGDFLYIFRIIDHQVTLIRAPSEDSLKNSLLQIYKQFNSSGRFTVTGRQWLSPSSLLIRISGGGYGDDLTFEAIIRISALGQISLDKESVKRGN